MLLGELASGARKLEELRGEEDELLSRATMEYATAPKTPELVEGRKQLVATAKKAVKDLAPEPALPAPEDVPEADMPAFWWLQ